MSGRVRKTATGVTATRAKSRIVVALERNFVMRMETVFNTTSKRKRSSVALR